MLSLYKLEIFNTVAMEGSFSQAAERLLLTQPAVSQHIRDLEMALDSVLFVRGNRGVRLTPAGETLLDYTRCILRLVAEAEAALSGLDDLTGGQVNIGATPGAGVYLLPGWVQAFHERYPGLSVSLSTDTTARIAADILAAKLDLGFVEGELDASPPLNALVLREIELFVVVGPGHPWWDESSITIESLAGEPFIARPRGSQTRSWMDQVFSLHGIAPNVVAEFDHPEAIKHSVASGMGITILPEWGMSAGRLGESLHCLSIQGVELRRSLKLLWSGDNITKPAARAFLTLLAGHFPQLSRFITVEAGMDLDLPGRDEYRASRSCTVSP